MGLLSSIGSVAGSFFGGSAGGAIGGALGGALEGGGKGQEQLSVAAQHAKQLGEVGTDFYGDYKNTYLPIEQKMAKAIDVGIDPEYVAGRHGSEVQAQFNKGQRGALRNMQRYGVNPSDGKWMELISQQGNQLALNKGGAINRARQNVNDLNYTRRRDMMDFGMNKARTAIGAYSGSASGLSSLGSKQDSIDQRDNADWGALAQNIIKQYSNNNGQEGALSGVNGGFTGRGL